MKKKKISYDYGKGFKVVRAALELDQKTFAEKIGVNPSYLSRIESGDKEPSPKILKRIDDLFDIPKELIQLLSINDNKKMSKFSPKEYERFGQVFLEILRK
jgi:transcriptional regulator with XRE-family HTH domain